MIYVASKRPTQDKRYMLQQKVWERIINQEKILRSRRISCRYNNYTPFTQKN